MLLNRRISFRSTTLFVLLLVGVLLVPANIVGAQSKVTGMVVGSQNIITKDAGALSWYTAGGSTCSAQLQYGEKRYTSNIKGTLSTLAAIDYPCKTRVCVVFCFNAEISKTKDYFSWMEVFTGTKNIPAETDIRVCFVIREGKKNGSKSCTPWASTSNGGWLDAPSYSTMPKPKNGIDGVRVSIESRSMPGRSITDYRFRSQLLSDNILSGLSDGNWSDKWKSIRWSSKGGGWADKAYTGGSAPGFAAGARPSMQVKLKNLPSPNLTASDVSLQSGGSTQKGKSVQFKGTVHNAGNLTTGKSFTNRFEYRWGTTGTWVALGNVNANTLGSGQTSPTLVSPSFALSQTGPLQVRLCADSGNTIRESNDSDNCSTTPVQFNIVALEPNLRISSLTRSPSGAISEGQTVTFTGIVQNSGTNSASASNARFCLNNTNCLNSASGRLGSDQAVSALGANTNSGSFTRTWTAVAGSNQTVTFCADTGKTISESDEGDNCSGTAGSAATLTFTVDSDSVVATLQVRNDTLNETAFKTPPQNKLSITAGHQLALQWNGAGATSCSGTNFNTGGSENGSTANVDEPAVGTSKTFSVTCENAQGAEDTAQIQVTAVAALPELTASKTTVLTGEPFTLTWDLNGNNPAECTLTGAGSDYEAAGSITTQTGNTTIDASGTATYTLMCAGSPDSVTIQVLPQVYES